MPSNVDCAWTSNASQFVRQKGFCQKYGDFKGLLKRPNWKANFECVAYKRNSREIEKEGHHMKGSNLQGRFLYFIGF